MGDHRDYRTQLCGNLRARSFLGTFCNGIRAPRAMGPLNPLYPGLLLSIDRDLTEVLMIALAVAGLYLIHRHRFLLGSFILALSVLARETILLLILALFAASVVAMLRKRASRFEAASSLIPLAMFAAWQLWTFHVWGAFGVVTGPGNFAPFFEGIRPLAQSLTVQHWLPRHWLRISELMLLAGAVVVTGLRFLIQVPVGYQDRLGRLRRPLMLHVERLSIYHLNVLLSRSFPSFTTRPGIRCWSR
jgi:hypothetical protein